MLELAGSLKWDKLLFNTLATSGMTTCNWQVVDLD